MKLEFLLIVAIFIGFVVLEIMFTQFFSKPKQLKNDGVFEILSTLILVGLTQPLVLLLGGVLASLIAPQFEGVLSQWSFLTVFLLFVIFDDLGQYWWHRCVHRTPSLFKLHRPHHDAEYLSVRIVFRNNVFFYLLMPNLWFSGVLIYFGGASVYGVYLTIKLTIIFAAHSDTRWDETLYANKYTAPIMWLVERVISTPATHSAHHGKYAADTATHYNGNFGNMLFLWDIIFGTAKITRRYPNHIGIENMPKTSLGEQLIWPLIKVDNSEPKDTFAVNK